MVKPITDPVGDLLARIRNAAQARHREVSVPYSKLREAVVKVLQRENYIVGVKKKGQTLVLELAYKRRKPIISGIKNVSKPGLHIYRKKNEIRDPLGGAGIVIISTPQGVMSSREAKKKGLGGEILGEVW